MVSDPFLVGVFFGFVPAMALLYILLHRYQGLYHEKRAFAAFFVGLAAGLVATLLQLFLGPRASEGIGLVLLNLALFGLVSALIFAMVLNSKRYRGRRDTPYYGIAFGLGYGALNVLFMIGNAVNRLGEGSGSVWVDTFSLVLLGLYFIGSILVHATVGAWIGRGAGARRILPDVFRGAALETLYLGGLFLLFLPTWSVLVPWLGIGLAVVLVHFALTRVLDPIVPPEVRREMEIHQRRLARSVVRGINRPSETDPDEPRTPGSPDEGPREPRPPNP